MFLALAHLLFEIVNVAPDTNLDALRGRKKKKKKRKKTSKDHHYIPCPHHHHHHHNHGFHYHRGRACLCGQMMKHTRGMRVHVYMTNSHLSFVVLFAQAICEMLDVCPFIRKLRGK